MNSNLSAWAVRGMGGPFSAVEIYGFISILISVSTGTADYVTLLTAVIITVTLPIFLNITAYKAEDGSRLIYLINITYAIMLSLLFCGVYIIISSIIIESPATYFSFLQYENPKFEDVSPLFTISLMFALSFILFQRYSIKIDDKSKILVSLPILIISLFVFIKYIARQEIREVFENAQSIGFIGNVSLAYLTVLTAIFLYSGMSRIIEPNYVNKVTSKSYVNEDHSDSDVNKEPSDSGVKKKLNPKEDIISTAHLGQKVTLSQDSWTVRGAPPLLAKKKPPANSALLTALYFVLPIGFITILNAINLDTGFFTLVGIIGGLVVAFFINAVSGNTGSF